MLDINIQIQYKLYSLYELILSHVNFKTKAIESDEASHLDASKRWIKSYPENAIFILHIKRLQIGKIKEKDDRFYVPKI